MNVEHFLLHNGSVTVNTLNYGHLIIHQTHAEKFKQDILACLRAHAKVAYRIKHRTHGNNQMCTILLHVYKRNVVKQLFYSWFCTVANRINNLRTMAIFWGGKKSVRLKRNFVLSLRSVFFTPIIHLTGDRMSLDKSFWWIHWHPRFARSLKVSVLTQESKDLNNRLL